ncbi:MAG: methylenetetrahydrofolate--tRNA-(uracil(54)-C(5))-methyltransferase (FADH(2)-oxidizing) TrmFO [Caldilineaceae bacterium SB0670_bin_27]|uniref:Methylenetetrahydrofolate--tRNA-(uracil-5-)-methyltransferase TrmFO n=1 Tax=Caldilineaceae bacterium SB0664_bin_27 TaxID=2605260 RepID=A0A6B0YXL4_9CHLR|nr:methylenetetrahydrofolate--tRNA-(uracil(54)-C(5))-methyltransferase (FADH(2)-oxidizing) TrmFO [Caldilineaceae bacterium SB0664_bin_27]MYJ77703.1 methylenetetrahydrofolate--tRNA-(uracil(54)-C(5))-methyltransferase (FADH(2)-oxidizing) TrmFO [Caldilineaceae bacterium SB0670_bin_27]
MGKTVTVVGGGLAGTEAAWQLAQRGISVRLFEMRPVRQTPAHVTDRLAELVCSNSMGSTLPDRALGILKNEMLQMGSFVIRTAFKHALPAGQALAVGRDEFAEEITGSIASHPRITLLREEVTAIPEGPTILATGPLTSDALTRAVQALTGPYLYFYDAMAPIVTSESIDTSIAFRRNRWDKAGSEGTDDGDYLNCPLNQNEYEAFVEALVAAPRLELSGADKELERYFEGCMPIEALAQRGKDALAFGPMRPVGLRDPSTGERPFAVVQLRQDNVAGTLYNLVGFQTNVKWGAQAEVLRMIPGLQDAEFVRLGQMHRNTFINSPTLLEPTLQFKGRDDLFFAGQITGTEGYVGSALGGLLSGINMARLLRNEAPLQLPRATMSGALFHYITNADADDFQPMKANMGLLPTLPERVRNKRERYAAYAARAKRDLEEYLAQEGFSPVS